MSKDDDGRDIFVAEKIFPDPLSVVTFRIPPIETIREQCDVVIDTNVLLLPYTTGSGSLHGIRTVYERLQRQRRLFVPAQVAREFARNRPYKIAEILKALTDKRSLAQKPAPISYPLVTDLPAYTTVKAREAELKVAIDGYQDALGALIDVIKAWGWGDPVSEIYRELFSAETICNHAQPEEYIRAELEYRKQHNRPPGYKDASKDDDGVGDLQIWSTILWLGETRKRPLVFVTGDEKADWQYRVEGRGFLPRYELVDEYRRASSESPFYIVSFSSFLELFEAPPVVVTEVREQERTEAIEEVVQCPNCSSDVRWTLGGRTGSSAFAFCSKCESRFHIHRSAEGAAFVRKPFSRPDPREESPMVGGAFTMDASDEELAECPSCSETVTFLLGRETGSSAKPRCRMCNAWFHAHRTRGGSILVRLPGVSAN